MKPIRSESSSKIHGFYFSFYERRIMEVVYEEILKASEDLKVGDEFRVGDVLMNVEKVIDNQRGDLVLSLAIVGATIKKRSKSMLIIPKKIPIVTLT